MKNIMPPSDDQSPNIENDGTGAVNQSSSSTEDQVQRPSSASETKSIDEQRRDLLSRVEAALDGEVVLTEQAMIDGLDLLTELLQRENSCLSTAVSIWDYTSRATFTNRLTELVNVVCVKYETQTRVSSQHSTFLFLLVQCRAFLRVNLTPHLPEKNGCICILYSR
jgi:hypothetical protein